jgi:hypothetical protein
MLAQLGGDRVGHDLAAMDFGGLAPVNSGMPIRVRVAVNGHSEIASADPLLHDLFKLGRCLFLLIDAASFLLIAQLLAAVAIRRSLNRIGDLDRPAGGFVGAGKWTVSG